MLAPEPPIPAQVSARGRGCDIESQSGRRAAVTSTVGLRETSASRGRAPSDACPGGSEGADAPPVAAALSTLTAPLYNRSLTRSRVDYR